MVKNANNLRNKNGIKAFFYFFIKSGQINALLYGIIKKMELLIKNK